jgi:hypothetical protein
MRRRLRLAPAFRLNARFASRADLLWGRLPTCGRLLIGLPAALTTSEQRQCRQCRLWPADMRGSLLNWGRAYGAGPIAVLRSALRVLKERRLPTAAQDAILCRIATIRKQRWRPSSVVGAAGRPIDDRPQVNNLPHKRFRISIEGIWKREVVTPRRWLLLSHEAPFEE